MNKIVFIVPVTKGVSALALFVSVVATPTPNHIIFEPDAPLDTSVVGNLSCPTWMTDPWHNAFNC